MEKTALDPLWNYKAIKTDSVELLFWKPIEKALSCYFKKTEWLYLGLMLSNSSREAAKIKYYSEK